MPQPLDILGLTRAELAIEVGILHGKPGKGAYHADAVFKDLYENARFAPELLPEFGDNPGLAERVRDHFRLALPDITGRQGDGDTFKFLLKVDGESHEGLQDLVCLVTSRM